MSFRFVPPANGLPGMVWDGDKIVTAEYLTPAQARTRAHFWTRKNELDLLEALRAEAMQPEMYSAERA